mgnify:CR=1 FL=1
MKNYQMLLFVTLMLLIGIYGWNSVEGQIEAMACNTDIECQIMYNESYGPPEGQDDVILDDEAYNLDVIEGDQE